MNYYERWLGDYARDTSHLSVTQHGVYALLLDAYYSQERALPPSLAALNRICRAMTRAEREAVAMVADEFFPINGDGMRHNRRADREIVSARERIERARTNGKGGGRPKKNPEETQKKPSGFAKPNPDRNPDVTHEEPAGKAPHTPYPNVFNLAVENEAPTEPCRASSPDALPSESPKERKTRELRHDAQQVLAFLNAKAGRNFQSVAANIDPIVARLREGFTAQQMRQVVALKCRKWKGDEKMDEYLRPATLFNRTKFASYAGELVADGGDDE